MKFLPLLLGNLGRRKMRTVLTALSILVAFVLYGYLAAIGKALEQGVSMAGADRLMVRNRVSIAQPLPESYGARLARQPGVAGVALFVWFGGIYQDPKNFFAQMAVRPEALLDMYPEYLLPGEQREKWLATRDSVIVGRRTAVRFGWKVGDRIPLEPTVWRKKSGEPVWDFELAGIYDGANKGTDDTNFFLHYDYLEEARSYGKGVVSWYIVRVRDPRQADAVARHIDKEFANSPWETKAETEGAFLRGWARQIGDITTIMRAILGAVFFTILLVAGNTMAQSVRERTDEIGVLKAIGFSNGQVLGMVLFESCLLAGVGGILGLGLALWLISRGDPTGGALPMFFFPGKRVIEGAGLALALGLAAGILPAVAAMRLRVAEALRR